MRVHQEVIAALQRLIDRMEWDRKRVPITIDGQQMCFLLIVFMSIMCVVAQQVADERCRRWRNDVRPGGRDGWRRGGDWRCGRGGELGVGRVERRRGRSECGEQGETVSLDGMHL